MDSPYGRVNPIENRHNQSRIVDFQTTIEADNLKYSRYGQKDDRHDWSKVTKLISFILA